MHCMQHAPYSTIRVGIRYMQLKLQAHYVPGFWLALFAGGAAVAAFASTLRLTCSWKLPICRMLSELNQILSVKAFECDRIKLSGCYCCCASL